MNRIELLMPAGNKAAFLSALYNGADAIYLGMKNFGARAFSDNFETQEVVDLIKLAHRYGVKVYITMNTLISDNEMDNAIKMASFLYHNQVDALIIQDLGFFNECKKRFVNLELHASTQVNINNILAAKKAIELGFNRVVLAREMSLDKIQEITNLGIECEVFAHGALCISYSGQCLMSSVLYNRSGNRGTCAQCCRLPYKLFNRTKNTFLELDDEYLLSPKDLNTLENIPDLIKAGIASLKVEGRMKRSEYVGLVTRLYRMAIDAYYEGRKFVVTDNMIKELKLMFNRGFTKGYAFNVDSNDLYNPYRPNHIGICVGEVISNYHKQIFIKLSDNISQGDGLRIIDGQQENGLIANKIYKDGLLVNKANKNDIVAFDYKFINPKAKVYKTSDIKLMEEINAYPIYRKLPLKMTYDISLSKGLILKAFLNDMEVEVKMQDVVFNAANKPLNKDMLIKQLSKFNDTSFKLIHIEGVLDDGVFVRIKDLNEARRLLVNKLYEILDNPYKRDELRSSTKLNIKNKVLKTLIEVNTIEAYQRCKDLNVELITANKSMSKQYHITYINPNINENAIVTSGLASELGSLDQSKGYYINLNIYNSYALAYVLSIKDTYAIVSSELNDIQLQILHNNFINKYCNTFKAYQMIYGKRTLMYIKKPLPMLDNDLYELIDKHSRHFKLILNEEYMEILEDKPMQKELQEGYQAYIRFTDESLEDINLVLDKYLKVPEILL